MVALIICFGFDVKFTEQVEYVVMTSARQRDMFGKLLRACNNARFAVHGHAHGLCFMEFRVRECR